MLGGVGAFAAVAYPKVVDDDAPESGDSPAVTTDPGPEASEPSAITAYLKEQLGADLTAYLAGVDEAELIEHWALGRREPSPLSLGRLRAGYQAARHIVRAYGGETAQSWFSGMNPWLEDEAPAYVLRHSDHDETWESVVGAAEEFVEFER